MKVLLVVGKLGGGGAERVALSWVQGLVGRGHDVRVLTHVVDEAGTGYNGAVTHVVLGSKLARWTRLPMAIRAAIQRERPDVVLSVLDFCNSCSVLATWSLSPRGGRPRLVLSEHTVMSLYLRSQGWSGVVRHQLGRLLYRRADAVVAVSHAVATDLLATYRVPPERVVVLPNPVTLPSRRRTPDAPPAARPLEIVYVGRLIRDKRPDIVLTTVAELRARGRACSVVFIGDGPMREELATQAGTLGVAAHFAGWRKDWRDAAGSSDCLLLTSPVEGFGIVLVEAADFGLPCVAPSTALGVVDAVVPGLTGVLARSGRPDDLADAVLEAAQLRVNPPEAWARQFREPAITAAIERVLDPARGR